MLILQGVSYTHPNKAVLFNDISLNINKHDKVALIGNNGAGKSTLLKILAGALEPSEGSVRRDGKTYYVPQLSGQYNDNTIAEALHAAPKLNALKAILNGEVTERNMVILDDDWTIEERCKEALAYWGLEHLNPEQKLNTISGGQKTKVFLSGIQIHKPEIVLLDEPSNHLDSASRNVLYEYIKSTNQTLAVVSHDRTLLNLMQKVYELSKGGITIYGGNYDRYAEQKAIERNAYDEGVKNKEKELRKAKDIERETIERQQKLDARGKKKQEKAGLPTISMNTLRNNAERSTARIKNVHSGKVETIREELTQLRKGLPDKDKMKIGFDDADIHKGKILVTAEEINAGYADKVMWKEPLNFVITSGERIAIKGENGSGKTTLVKMILGELEPKAGIINRAEAHIIYIDQDYKLINDDISVYEQVEKYNKGKLEQHEVKSRLTHFLFTKEYWDKPCEVLSGGEKMRLILCCLTISDAKPDMIILDEPTNNLDIQNIDILTNAINEYNGTIIVISHDAYFLNQIQIKREIALR